MKRQVYRTLFVVERRLCKVKVCDGVGVPLLGEDVENVVEISCKLFDIFKAIFYNKLF